MAHKNYTCKEFSAWFENLPLAETIRKMMGRQEVGSFCAEMIEKIRGQQEDGFSFRCVWVMREMMRECSEAKKEPEESRG